MGEAAGLPTHECFELTLQLEKSGEGWVIRASRSANDNAFRTMRSIAKLDEMDFDWLRPGENSPEPFKAPQTLGSPLNSWTTFQGRTEEFAKTEAVPIVSITESEFAPVDANRKFEIILQPSAIKKQ